MRYIGGCLRALIAGGHRAMEPTRAAHEDYYARTQKELETLVWSHPSIEHPRPDLRSPDGY
jgi:4-hydroxyacetophenone monooxygenase